MTAAVWTWGTFLAIHVLVPGWYRGNRRTRVEVFTFIVPAPVFVLARGLADPAIARVDFRQSGVIAVLRGTALCVLTWIVFHYADRRLLVHRAPEPPKHSK